MNPYKNSADIDVGVEDNQAAEVVPALSDRDVRLATTAGVLSCLIWSFAVLVAGTLSEALGPLTAAGVDFIIGGGALTVAMVAKGKVGDSLSHSPAYFSVCGFFGVLNIALFWMAVGSSKTPTDLLVVGLLNNLWPSLTLLLSVLILGKKAGWYLPLGLFIAATGVILSKVACVVGVGAGPSIIGDLMSAPYLYAFCAALSWALYSNFSNRLGSKDKSSPIPMFLLLSGIPLVMVGHALGEVQDFTPSIVTLSVGWSILTALSYLMWDIGMRRGNVVGISICALGVPFVSTIATAFGEGLPLTAELSGAAAMVVLGALLCQRGVYD